MQYRESLFQVDGSSALKTHAAPHSARIIEFPSTQDAAYDMQGMQRELGIGSLKRFAHNALRKFDDAFSVSKGTAKGVGPRFATRRESALIIGTCALAVLLTVVL